MAASTAAENADRAPAIMGILWTESAISLIFTALRFYARGMIRKIGWDDWLMALKTALFVSCTGLVTAQASGGGYLHQQFLSMKDAIYALKINFILRGVDILAYATGKASIGALILRIIGHQNKWQRNVVWVVIILTALLNVLNTIFNFVQCHPVSANWERTGSFKCWPARAQLDFAYFMSGGEYGLTVWGVSEIFVIIVTGCIPTLKPIYDRCFSGGKNKNKSFQLSDAGKTNYRTAALDGYINLPEGYNTPVKLMPLPTKTTPARPFAGDVDEDTRHSVSSIDQFRPTTQSPLNVGFQLAKCQCGGEMRLPVVADIESMPYMAALVKETLRWRPTVPLVPPHELTEEQLEYDGFIFPKGTNFLINTVAVSQDCTDPERFMPERWMDESKNELNIFHDFWGFGAGRRICVGYKIAQQILFLAISELIFCFGFVPNGPYDSRKLNPWSGTEPFPVKVTLRSSSHGELIRKTASSYDLE